MFNFNWILHNSDFIYTTLPHNIFHTLIYYNLICRSNYKCKNQLLSANRKIKKALLWFKMTLIIPLLIGRDLGAKNMKILWKRSIERKIFISIIVSSRVLKSKIIILIL